MTPEELEKVKEEVADTLHDLIKMGMVETTAIDEDGNFCYVNNYMSSFGFCHSS